MLGMKSVKCLKPTFISNEDGGNMDDSFDRQDKIFEYFIGDTTLIGLLGITDVNDNDQLNSHIRREVQSVDLLTTDSLPFIVEYFPNTHPTSNYRVNSGVLEIDVYAGTRYDAMLLSKRIKEILEQNYEDTALIHEGQVSSGVKGIYEFSMRFKPLIKS